MRIDSPLSSRLCQPPDLSEALGPRASPSVSLPVSRSIPGFRKLARSITILTIEAKLVGKRVTGALLLIALPFKKQTSQRMRSMSTSPVFRPDCKDQLLLPEQDPVGFAQRLTGIIGTRSLGSSPIQLENLQPFARAQPLDGAETNIISANEKSWKVPRDRIDSRFKAAAPKMHSVTKDTSLRVIPRFEDSVPLGNDHLVPVGAFIGFGFVEPCLNSLQPPRTARPLAEKNWTSPLSHLWQGEAVVQLNQSLKNV